MDVRKQTVANAMKKNVISIIGDHYAQGPRDLCGLNNRLFIELSELDPSTCWSVLSHGSLGGIKSVVNSTADAFADMFSYEADRYTAIIWVGVGESKSGGIPLDAWAGMLDHLICMVYAADVDPILILPVVPPQEYADKNLRKWCRRAHKLAIEVANKREVRTLDLPLGPDSFVDLYALKARTYQQIATELGRSFFVGSKKQHSTPRLVSEPEVIYKHKSAKPAPTKRVETNNSENSVAIMQPDRVRSKRSAHG